MFKDEMYCKFVTPLCLLSAATGSLTHNDIFIPAKTETY